MMSKNILKLCPICGRLLLKPEEEFDYSSFGGIKCEGCNETFNFDKEYGIWRNDNIIDISYREPKSSMLSNLFPHKFMVKISSGDFLNYASMEAFLRTLCLSEEYMGAFNEVSMLHGYDAWRVRNVLIDFRKNQTVYWDGNAIKRNSGDYQKLLAYAYDSLFEHSVLFRMALKKSKGKILCHTMGTKNPKETLLTPIEYITMLERERNKL